MAALLRHGARRVGVSAVQRTRAAFTTPVVAAQERRLLNTEVPSAIKAILNGSEVLTADEVQTISRFEIERLNQLGLMLRPKGAPVQDVRCLIQERKEELYDLISLMEGTPVRNNYQNRQLLKFLSVQVKPRPDDSAWRRMRAIQRMKDVARAIVLASGCTLAYEVYSAMARGELNPTAKKLEQ